LAGQNRKIRIVLYDCRKLVFYKLKGKFMAERLRKQSDDLNNLIKMAQLHNCTVGAYGLGIWGREYGLCFLDWLNIKIDFICDRDLKKLSDYSGRDIQRLSCDEVLCLDKETIIFVNIGQYYLQEVVETLQQNRNLRIVTIDKIIDLNAVVERFYEVPNMEFYEQKNRYSNKRFCLERYRNNFYDTADIYKDRVAVYTCIIGGYDAVHEPFFKEENCDYYLISDEKPEELKVFEWIDAKKIVPVKIKEPAEINRYCKMHGDIIFKDYKNSVYMDGKIQLVKGVSHYICQTGSSGLAMHRHGFMDCIYTEGIRMVGCGCCKYEAVKEQMQRYIYEGMPRHFGQFECAIIARNHENEIGKKIMRDWFHEYMAGQKRDQLSLPYVLWKNGLTSRCIGEIYGGIPWKKNSDFIRYTVHQGQCGQ